MIRIGKIAGTHGLKGAVILTHILQTKEDWLTKEIPLFIALQRDTNIPFFAEEVQVYREGSYLVSFEDVATVEAARKLVGKAVFAEEKYLNVAAADTPLLWIGFEVMDETLGNVGRIKDIFQTAHQWLAELDHNGKEVLLPLVEQTIKGVDLKNKILRMDLPEGIMDL